MQDWLHNGDEFSIAFKVNYMSEDLLLVTVTSRWIVQHDRKKQRKKERKEDENHKEGRTGLSRSA